MAAFLIVVVFAAVLCALAFFAVASVASGVNLDALLAGDLAGEQVGNSIALLSFILGTAATVAGAIASVTLANLALRLSMDAERREAVAFAADRIDAATAHYAKIASALNRTIGVAGLIESEARFFERNYVYGMTGLSANEADKLARALRGPGAHMADAFDMLADALDAALCDEFTRFALQKTAEADKPGWLADLGHAFAKAPQAGRPPSLHDLPEFVAQLRASAYRLREDPSGAIVAAWRHLPEALKRNPESHEILERPATLFFLVGNLVDLRAGAIGDTGARYAVRAGVAMVADFAAALPGPTSVRTALLQRYRDALPRRRFTPVVHFEPDKAYSRAFRAALEDARGLSAPLGDIIKPPPT